MSNKVFCGICLTEEGYESNAEISLINRSGEGINLYGLLICRRKGHRWPINMLNDTIVSTAGTLPVTESQKLAGCEWAGIVEDQEEAELAHFNRNYKASVVMCRRALQLSLENVMGVKGDERKSLGQLLKQDKGEQNANKRVLSDSKYHLASRVKNLGDGGAHSRVEIDHKAVEVAIFDSVDIIRELYQKVRPSLNPI